MPVKVLIADDDQVQRKILEGFLKRENYQVVVAEDGQSALKLALTFTEPYIAILDWVMPGLTGPQVCVCLRSPKLKVRPFIIVLSARSDKADIAAVLDAGADDFLTKPFNQVELLARLRVAGRSLQYHNELRQQISQLEALAQRYNLLGEIVAQQNATRLTTPPMKPAVKAPAVPAKAAVAPAPVPVLAPVSFAESAQAAATAIIESTLVEETVAGQADEVPVIAKPDFKPVLLTREEADIIMQGVLTEMGFPQFGMVAAASDGKYQPAEYTAWAGLVMEREGIWMDLLLEVDSAAMAMIFEKTLGRRPKTIEEKTGVLAETHTIVSAAFKAALIERGAPVMTPLLSKVLDTKDRDVPVPHDIERHRYALAGGTIGLTIARHDCPVKMKSTFQLKHTDIMAEAYPSTSVNDVALLNKGTILTPRFIDKLIALEESEGTRLSVPVFSAPLLAGYFIGY